MGKRTPHQMLTKRRRSRPFWVPLETPSRAWQKAWARYLQVPLRKKALPRKQVPPTQASATANQASSAADQVPGDENKEAGSWWGNAKKMSNKLAADTKEKFNRWTGTDADTQAEKETQNLPNTPEITPVNDPANAQE